MRIFLIGNGMLNSFVGRFPVMHGGPKMEAKALTDEDVELKVELGKLDDDEDVDAVIDPGYQSNKEEGRVEVNSVAECDISNATKVILETTNVFIVTSFD